MAFFENAYVHIREVDIPNGLTTSVARRLATSIE
jgi:hypothetical protein